MTLVVTTIRGYKSMDNPVMHFLNKMADLMLLNFVYIICCLPIITIGAATTAMYHVTLRSIRYGDGYVLKEFFLSFKQNIWSSTGIWLMAILVGGILGLDFYFWLVLTDGVIRVVMTGISSCILFFYIVILLYIFPVQAKLQGTIWRNLKNAVAMGVGHLFPYTFVCLCITGLFLYAFYVSLAADIIAMLIGFSLLAYIQSFFFYKIFAMYIDEEPIGEDDPLYRDRSKTV